MAIFNAFCDRVPMLVLGATGPWDAAIRRPWIDWIHTAADQGALVRGYVKWDDQPGSPAAALEAVMRADTMTRAYPPAPVYVCSTRRSRRRRSPRTSSGGSRPPPAARAAAADRATAERVRRSCVAPSDP